MRNTTGDASGVRQAHGEGDGGVMATVELIQGDCLEVMRGMPDKSVDAVITDPPYGIGYQSARRIDKNDRFDIIKGDKELSFEWMTEAKRITKDSGFIFCFCRWDTEHLFFNALVETGYKAQSQVIWDRGIHGLGDLKRQYAPMHDNALFATLSGYEFPRHRPKSIYRVDRLSADKLVHPTQKPVSLIKLIINDLTIKDAIILDPFAGSGTTGIAAIQTERQSILIEIDPTYFAIAQERIRVAQMQPNLFEATQ